MYTYYKCAAAKKKKTCDKKAVRKQWLEDLAVNETMKLVEGDASMNAIIAKVMELQNQESTDLPIWIAFSILVMPTSVSFNCFS